MDMGLISARLVNYKCNLKQWRRDKLMYRQILGTCVILCVFLCGSTFARLILQPQSPGPIQTSDTTTTTVVFDLIVENSTSPGAASGGGDLIYNFDSVGIEFCTLDNGLSFSSVGSAGIQKSAGTDNADWTLFAAGSNVNISNTVGGIVTLNPGESFGFATLSVDLPVNFAGDFSLTLNRTLSLTSLASGDATSDPPAFDPAVRWVGDPSPPFGKSDPNIPGSQMPASFIFTAVPEPSPVLLLGLVACLVGGRRYLRRG